MVRNRFPRLLFAVFFLIRVSAGAELFASDGLFEPSAEVVRFAARIEAATVADLAEIALAFSGVAPQNRSEYIDSIIDLIDGFGPYLGEDAYENGDALLLYLHDRVFTRYHEPQTLLDEVLDTGAYNCVSSSVLYYLVAYAYRMPVLGTMTPDHAFCILRTDDRVIDIETTSRYGFDPGRRKEFHDEFGNLTGYSYVPPSNRRGRTEIDGASLIALILHNRISDADRQGRYDAALSLAVDRHAFLKTDESLADLARELGNYVASLNMRNDFAAALDALDQGLARYELFGVLAEAYHGVVHNRILTLLNSGAYEQADSVLEGIVSRGYLDDAAIEALQTMSVGYRLADVLPGLDIDEAFDYLASVRDNTNLPDSVFREHQISLMFRLAEDVSSRNGYYDAALVIDRAIAELGSDGNLTRARQVYRYNYGVQVHNEFASLFNTGEYRRALDLVADALQRVPEHALLARDLKTVQSAIDSATNR